VKPFFPSPHATASSNRVVAPLGPSKAREDADKVLGEANKVHADAAEEAEFERLMVEMTETSPRTQSGIQLCTSDLTKEIVSEDFVLWALRGDVLDVAYSDAHESSILAEALGLASIFLPRNRLALLEPYSITLGCSPHSFSVVPPFSTALDATRLYSRGGRTPRRPSTRLVLDSPTRVHHWLHSHPRLKGRVQRADPLTYGGISSPVRLRRIARLTVDALARRVP
jgi:hypothetical protein